MNPVPVGVAKSTNDVVAVRGENFVIPGVRVSAVASGMRYRDRLDLALIVADREAGVPVVGTFTRNLFTAAPVALSRQHLARRGEAIRAILVNAGIANACTGDEGMRRAKATAEMVARALRVEPEAVLVASTGVIGPQITLDVVERSMDELVGGLAPNRWDEVARAIMTTDTVPKLAFAQFPWHGETAIVGGVAKGSGMIAPDMATMLGFICTNVALDRSLLDRALRQAISRSFNAILVDGDTSTNDTVFLLASGVVAQGDRDTHEMVHRFTDALEAVSRDLAHQIVLDGEGATKFITVCVTGARSEGDAAKIAKTVAASPLVKTAFYGEDANWGRIIAAVGRAGVPLETTKVSLFFDDLCVFREGVPILTEETEKRADEIVRRKSIVVTVDLAVGAGSARYWTCDLSHDYVTINAKYRT